MQPETDPLKKSTVPDVIMQALFTAIHRHEPLVVGAVGDRAALDGGIAKDECDLVELRLDALGWEEEIVQIAKQLKESHPLLLTTRHPDEGGANELSARERASAFRALLDHGSLIDLELRSLDELGEIWDAAGARGLVRIASWHNFSSCPSKAELEATIEAMRASGADIAKCAFLLQQPSDLLHVADLLEDAGSPRAVMGMGPLAPASRILAATMGSVLNYGYLGEAATAPGQWPAGLLKAAVAQSR